MDPDDMDKYLKYQSKIRMRLHLVSYIRGSYGEFVDHDEESLNASNNEKSTTNFDGNDANYSSTFDWGRLVFQRGKSEFGR